MRQTTGNVDPTQAAEQALIRKSAFVCETCGFTRVSPAKHFVKLAKQNVFEPKQNVFESKHCCSEPKQNVFGAKHCCYGSKHNVFESKQNVFG